MEESFPRGGTLFSGNKRAKIKKDEENLFKSETEGASSKKKRKIITKNEREESLVRKRKKSTEMFYVTDHKTVVYPSVLMRKNLGTDMLILGCIQEINEFDMLISLPNGHSGVVPITNICDVYTKKLHELAMVEDDNNIEQHVASLGELFHIGQLVRTKIIDVPQTEGKSEPVKLSINPKHVNSALSVKMLHQGMVLSACVSSEEDHGYVLDLGIPGTSCFLRRSESSSYVSDYNDGRVLQVGSYLHCLVTNEGKPDDTRETRVIKVTVNSQKVHKSVVQEDMDISLDTLLPGLIVEGNIIKKTDDGLIVKFLSFTGWVHQSHLRKAPSAYNRDNKLPLAVLYTDTTLRAVALSDLSHLTGKDSRDVNPFVDLTVGDVIDDAVVRNTDKMLGVYFKLRDNITARAQKNHLSGEKVTNVKTFEQGQKHRCRIIGFDYVDRVVLVSLKQAVLNKQFLRHSQVRVGQVVVGKVARFLENGILVRLTDNMLAYTPNIHLADIPLHRPEKKFSVGQELKFKVLLVNPDQKRIYLTHKKSLLSSKYPDLTDYSQCSVGLIAEGTILKILDHGLVIKFFGDVQGFVPKREVSKDTSESLEQIFYVGQVVRCMVKSWKPDVRSLILSLKLTEKDITKATTLPVPDEFEFGKLVDCKVKSKSAAGLKVALIPSGTSAFIPTAHLSDHHDNWPILLEMYDEGDVITGAICWQRDNTVMLSKKKTLIEAYQSGNILNTFEELQPGLLVAGFIKKRMNYGLFICISPTLWGLCPNKYISDQKLDKPSILFREGQSVIGKIIEVNNDKKRFLLSLRMSDCYHGNIENGLELLSSYLEEYKEMKQHIQSKKGPKSELCHFFIGQIIEVVVTKVTDHGVLCKHANGIEGFVAIGNMPGETCVEGSTIEVVVLFIDLQAKCLELSLNQNLIKAIIHLSNNKFSQARVNQVVKSEVHLVKEHFILVALKGHAQGRLAYLPARKHANDIFEKQLFIIGQTNPIVVKSVQDDCIIGCLEMHQEEADSLTLPSDDKFNQVVLEVGLVVNAVILSVQDLQLTIKVGRMKGRVHITEVTDVPVEGKNPLKQFREGQQVKVRVLAFKEMKGKKKKVYLPISRPKKGRLFVECTMRKSKLESEELDTFKRHPDVIPGQSVQAFVIGKSSTYIMMTVSPVQKARVHLVNTSRTLPLDSSQFQIGSYYKGVVLNSDSKDYLELSLLDPPWKIEAGEKTIGLVKSVNPWRGLILQLSEGLLGRVSLVDLSDNYSKQPVKTFVVDQCVECFILECNVLQQPHCLLSLRESRLNATDDTVVQDPEVNNINDVRCGSIIRGYIYSCDENGIFVTLGTSVTGRVSYTLASEYFILSPEKVFLPGLLVTAKVTSIDTQSERITLSLLEKDTGCPDLVPLKYRGRKRKQDSSKTVRSKSKRRKISKDVTDSGVESDSSIDDPKLVPSEAPRLSLPTDFTWDDSIKLPLSTKTKDDHSESDSEEEDQPSADSRKRKLSKAEQRLEEQKLFERERLLMSGQCAPETVADFDRLVLESPDSSLIWLRYMAFHLETAEIEKARAVAERALKTISFREEQEKLNVWVAYLNLENMYGTEDTLNAVFKRALQYNDQLKVYNQLIQIYTKSNKIKEAETLYQSLVKRFSVNKDVWISFGEFYFEHGEAEKARKLMQRSFKSLPVNQHVDVISKFGQFEFKYGEPERGKTIFENLLSSYVKRTDLWSVYIDMLTKLGDLDIVRRLYERVISLNLSTKKMRFFFKKYLNFEEKFGDEETVKAVKQKALEYVEKKSEEA